MKIKLFTALIGMFLMMTAEIFAGQTVDPEVCYETRGNLTYVESIGNTCKEGSYTCTENSCNDDDDEPEEFKEGS